MKRLISIGVIWLGCAIAWLVLGSALVVRSGEASSEITQEVQRLWGPSMRQLPPRVLVAASRGAAGKGTMPATRQDGEQDEEAQQQAQHAKQGPELVVAPKAGLGASDIAVRLSLTHRQKGLLWFPTYEVDFSSKYLFVNNAEEETAYTLEFPLQAGEVVYDGFAVIDEEGRARR